MPDQVQNGVFSMSRFFTTSIGILATSISAFAQCNDKQFTVATVKEHFQAQALNGIVFSYPVLELNSESRDKHFGTLRTNKDNHPDCRTVYVRYRVDKQTSEGSVVLIDYNLPAFTQSFLAPSLGSVQTVIPQPKRIPAEKKTEGPFLLMDPEVARLPQGSTFDPIGVWTINGTATVNLSNDSENSRREIWKIERLKPELVAMPVHPAIFTDSARKWKNSSGKFLFDGVFLDRDEAKNIVRIYTDDGKVNETPFFDLHLSDRKWVNEKVTARESKSSGNSSGYGDGYGAGGVNSPKQRSGKSRRK